MSNTPKNKVSELSGIPWGRRKSKSPKPRIPWREHPPGPQHSKTGKAVANTHLHLGQQAEHTALEYLMNQGLTLVMQNHRCKCGELDLVMAQGDCAVVVEVRARSRSDYGLATESVSWAKQQRVSRCAALWWAREGQRKFRHLRFDVVALQNGLSPQWIQNAWQL
ncbi:MAG TPA: YraN family protein [Limnobacter sp.]|nr:YraN family protein [Limnobacter sp.]